MSRRTTRPRSAAIPPGRPPSASPPSRRPLSRALVLGLAGLTACSGSDVSAPVTTVIEPDQVVSEQVRGAVLPEIVAAPSQEDVEADTDPTTFFVSPETGDDANDGQTTDTPFATLQGALDRLEAGQTLYLLSGRYDETTEPGNAHYTIDVSGTAEDWIRVTAAPGAEPEIVANDGNGVVVRGDYVEVSGLRVRGEGFGVDNPYGWGMLIRNSHHVRLADNVISDMAVGGIASVESSNLEIVANEVFDNAFWGTEQGSGISVWHSVDNGAGPDADGYHDRIIGNIVYRNENRVYSRWHTDKQTITDGNGIIIDQTDQTGYTGRILVANNLVFDNGGRAVLVLESSWVDIIHNTAYHNGRTATLEGGPVEIAAGEAEGVRVLNNILWSRKGVPPFSVDDSADVEMGGNVLVTDTGRGPATALDLVIVNDAGLVAPGIDPRSADFRPRATSVAVGQALVTDPRIPSDIDGADRPATGASAGAYEVGEGSSSTGE